MSDTFTIDATIPKSTYEDSRIIELSERVTALEQASKRTPSIKEETHPRTTKLIFSYGLARFLLGKGCTMVDLSKDKRDKTTIIFIFKLDDKLKKSLEEFSELRKAAIKKDNI